MYLSKNIKYLRRSIGLNQTQLGERVGKTKEVISTYERGKIQPPIDVVLALSKVFNITMEDLLVRNIEKEGLPQTIKPEPKDETLVQMNQLMAQRIKELEREIRRHNPELAEELGIE